MNADSPGGAFTARPPTGRHAFRRRRASLRRTVLQLSILIGAVAIALSITGALATAASVTPSATTGNVSCPAGTTQLEANVNSNGNTGSGTATNGTFTVSFSFPSVEAGAPVNSLDFTASAGTTVMLAIIKASEDSNVYDYRPGGVTSDTNLFGADNTKSISHVRFCVVATTTTTTTTSTVTTTSSVPDTTTTTSSTQDTTTTSSTQDTTTTSSTQDTTTTTSTVTTVPDTTTTESSTTTESTVDPCLVTTTSDNIDTAIPLSSGHRTAGTTSGLLLGSLGLFALAVSPRARRGPRLTIRWLALLGVVAAALMLVQGPGMALASVGPFAPTTTLNVTPTSYSGTEPSCATGTLFRDHFQNFVNGPNGGTVFEDFTVGGNTVTVTLTFYGEADGDLNNTFDFTISGGALARVFVKGDAELVYDYGTGAVHDTGLHDGVQDGVYKDISHLDLCLTSSVTTTTSSTTVSESSSTTPSCSTTTTTTTTTTTSSTVSTVPDTTTTTSSTTTSSTTTTTQTTVTIPDTTTTTTTTTRTTETEPESRTTTTSKSSSTEPGATPTPFNGAIDSPGLTPPSAPSGSFYASVAIILAAWTVIVLVIAPRRRRN